MRRRRSCRCELRAGQLGDDGDGAVGTCRDRDGAEIEMM